MKAKTTRQWLTELEEVGIACGPVNTIKEVATDPQVLAREMFVEVHHHQAGSFKVTNTPIKLSRTPSKIERASPDLGEDTKNTLKELLGITEQELADLENNGVI